MARPPAQRRRPAHPRSEDQARSGVPKKSRRGTRAEGSATVAEYRTLEEIAAAATTSASAHPTPNTYRTAAASHRVAARAAEEAGLTHIAQGHDVAARDHDETAETLAAARRAQDLRSEPTLEAEVRDLLVEESRRRRSRET